MRRRLFGLVVWLAPFVVGGLAAGCTHDGFGAQHLHYATFSVPEPAGATVHVCHAYGCQKRTKFTFRPTDIDSLKELMAKVRGGNADTPEEERRTIAYAIGWMETRVGDVTGTKDDRAGMEFSGPGDPTQQDCVDEATNTTSYLNVLATAGLIRHHTVGVPFAKENYLRGISGWTHWTAVLVEKPFAGLAAKTARRTLVHVTAKNPLKIDSNPWDVAPSPGGQRWAIDSWIYANGENPAVVRAEDWYITDLDSLPAPKR